MVLPTQCTKRRLNDFNVRAYIGLTNVQGWHGQLEHYAQPFDIALGTHLCGAATDAAQALALRHQAVFVLTPCCLGAGGRPASSFYAVFSA